ncbi:MAG TPA: ATP-binding protein [Thermoanaerobaculia bacterium]|nr:ATP-binding protein [Thermoanaerobaculia bacterium]
MPRSERPSRPLAREIRLLIGTLICLLTVLIVALFAVAMSILQFDRVTVAADETARAIAPLAATASRSDLTARLDLLRAASGIGRIEVYRGNEIFAASGTVMPTAEVLTRRVSGGRVLLYFDVSTWAGGRRTGLVVAALATIATMAGLLVFILYVPKFVRPVEEMLDQANRLRDNTRGDHDARYLVQTFREAVEQIQQQSQEIDQLRDAAATRSPNVSEMARALNRNFSSGFLALDASGAVVAINDAGREILGITADPVGRSVAAGAFPRAFADVVRTSIEARAALTRREVLLEPSGTLIGITTVPIETDGAFLGLFALYTDLTTFRAMEARLRDLEALVGLGQMSAGIAHEFRNSLFTILGYLRLAQREGPADEQLAKVRNAETEAKKLASAVDALLNFSKPLKLGSQRLSLDALTSDVMERFASANEDISFHTEAAQPIEINGDRELLGRALENVVRNAVDAVRQRHFSNGGRVEAIVTAEPNPRVVIRDNGIGLDADQAASVLLPFQSMKAEGFGLGLPLARKIVLQHGGTLTISGTPGEGAAVVIELFP